MPDLIHLLPDSVANQIAAGEVIQRPASVIKELVENSIDAGASKITVHLKDAGRTLIQVTDDGKGMSPVDARMSFERHATSKIKNASDLFEIKTMGFRGEALASIASVADVELRTRREEDEIGTLIHIAASEIITQEAISCQKGTTFLVKNLFFNVPARRKFLKSNTTELKHVITEIQRVALASPEIGFSVFHNETILYELPSANFRKRIAGIFGSNINQSLIPIDSSTSIASISGFIGQPKFARRTFGEQFMFVNGRYMKHPFFHKGIIQAYEKILPSEMIPSYFINFEVDPSSIDINIHPTKTEIKFENESAIWQILHASVREGLGKFNIVPSIDFDQDGSFDIPVRLNSTQGLTPPKISFNPDYNPFQERSYSKPVSGFINSEYGFNLQGNEKIFPCDDIKNGELLQHDFQISNESAVQKSFYGETDSQIKDNCRNFIIVKNKYIITPVKSGLMIIDQKRAHQRILYEHFMEVLENHEGVCQQLLFPQTFETNASDAVILKSMLDDLNYLGFDLREFGNETFIINGIPGILGNSNPKEVIEMFLEEYKSSGSDIRESAKEQLSVSLAIASSIDQNHQLNIEEAGYLIDKLFSCETPNYSPQGKIIVEFIRMDEIEKKMK